MARLAFGGFDFAHEHADGLSRTLSTWAAPTYDASVTRSGRGRSAKILTTTAGGAAYYTLNTPGAANGDGIEYLFRTWVNFPALPSTSVHIVQPMASSVSTLGGGIGLNADGTVSFGVNGSPRSAALATNTWHCIEQRIVLFGVTGGAAGQGQWEELRVNGTVVSSFRQTSTLGGQLAAFFRFGLGVQGSNVTFSSPFTIYLDDWALNSNTGATDNSYPGIVEKVALLLPASDNAIGANWLLGNSTAPAGNAFAALDNTPPTGKAVASGLAGDQLRDGVAPTGVAADEFTVNLQTYGAGNVPPGAAIKAIQAVAEIAPSTASAATLGLQVTTNPVIAEATAATPATAAGVYPAGWTRLATVIAPTAVATGTAPVAKLRYVARAGTPAALVSAVGAYVAFEANVPEHIGTGAAGSSVSVGTTLDVPLPAGAGPGDWAVALIQTTDNVPRYALPAGWTDIGSYVDVAAGVRGTAFHKFVAAGETSYSFLPPSSANTHGVVHVLRGVGAAPVDGFAWSSANVQGPGAGVTSSYSPTLPASVVDNLLVLEAVANNLGSSAPAALTMGGTWVRRRHSPTGLGGAAVIAAFTSYTTTSGVLSGTTELSSSDFTPVVLAVAVAPPRPGFTVAPTAIASGEAVGTPTVTRNDRTDFPVTDNFNGVGGTDVTAHRSDSGHGWLHHPVLTDPGILIAGGGRARATTANGTFASSSAVGSPNQTVTAVFVSPDTPPNVTSGESYAYVGARLDPVANTRYAVEVTTNRNIGFPQVKLLRVNNGVTTQLGATYTVPTNANSMWPGSITIALSATGTGATVDLSVTVNGVVRITFADTAANRITANGGANWSLFVPTNIGGGVSDAHGFQIDSFTATDDWVHPTSIAGGGAVGTPVVGAATQAVAPSSIASAAAVGTPVVVGPRYITGAGAIGSAAAVGAPTVVGPVSPTGIASFAAVGAPDVSGAVKPTGIASVAALGTPRLTGGYHRYDFVAPGAPQQTTNGITRDFPIDVSGLGSIKDVEVSLYLTNPGGLRKNPVTLIAPSGTRVILIANNQGGSRTATGTGTADQQRTHFDSEAAVAWGSPSNAPWVGRFRPSGNLQNLNGADPNGRWVLRVADSSGGGSVSTIHVATLLIDAVVPFAPQTISVPSLPTTAAVGTPTVTGPIVPTSIPSGEGVGQPVVQGVNQFAVVFGLSIASAGAFGTPTVAGPVSPTSVTSTEAVGTPTVDVGEAAVLTVIDAGAIASAESFGAATLTQTPTMILPVGIPSAEAFGATAPVIPPWVVVPPPPDGSTTPGSGPVVAPVTAGRRASSLRDPFTNYNWPLNHSAESAVTVTRAASRGAPRLDVGFARQQEPSEPLVLRLEGVLLDPAQLAALENFYDRCGLWPVVFHDADGDEYEVIITAFDAHRVRGYNPHTHGSSYWRYSMQLDVLDALAGAYAVIA